MNPRDRVTKLYHYRSLKVIFTFVYLGLFLMSFMSCRKTSLNREASVNDIIETAPLVLTRDSSVINSAINGMYVTLPGHYPVTTKSYPLLIFIHGGGQIGSTPGDLTLLLNDGIAQLIYISKFPPNFSVSGKNYSFIILNPQFNKYPNSSEIEDIILFAKRTYRVDTSRIYLSGLSMGGFVTTQMGGDYTSQLAAIVAVSGVTNDTTVCRNIAAGKLPVWAFHNDEDPTINISTAQNFISMTNSFEPLMPAKLTVFKAAVHDAWTEALNPRYKEGNLNVYEWMLQYSR